MGNFFAELKRRQIYRVAAAYAVVAWVLIQLVGNLTPMLRLPEWAGTLVLVLLLIGFPVALLFSWIQHLAPADGERPPASTNLDWVLSGALIAVIALILYQQLAPRAVDGTQRSQQASLASAAADAAGIAIAVLPFTNLSGDAAQEFFSDGITEEINAALTKVPDLHVVARTSAFEFKGQNGNVRAVGEALSATHLIEGSVRRAGNRVRITAQLVRADSGLNLWSENYDRELTDIFAIQEDIAKAIATSLRVPLGLAQGDTLVRSRTSDARIYEDYLRAKALVRGRGADGLQQLRVAIALLEQISTKDPNYAAAYALLSTAYALIPVYHSAVAGGPIEEARTIVEDSLTKAESAAARALQLDPRSADGYIAMGLVQAQRGKWIDAQGSFSRALMLDGDNPDALHFYSGMLSDLGYLSQSVMMRQRLQVLDPFVPIFNGVTARIFWVSGQRDATEAVLAKLPVNSISGSFVRSRSFAANGKYGDAADALKQTTDSITPARMREMAADMLRTAPATTASFPRLGYYSFVYLYVGAADHALDDYDERLRIGFLGGLSITHLWERSYADLRKTERFKAFIRNAGIFDFWKAKGAPDLCRSLGPNDFVCD